MNMFCYQCEQTSQCTGCTSFGVCGKDPETAALQDLLVQLCKKISEKAHAKRQAGETTREADLFVM
jgi:hydroxylamine reductase